jgi:hypothetical protein
MQCPRRLFRNPASVEERDNDMPEEDLNEPADVMENESHMSDGECATQSEEERGIGS